MMNRRHKTRENKTEYINEEFREQQDNELSSLNETSKHFKQVYEFTDKCSSFIYKTFLYLLNISGIYLIWISLHFIASQLYIYYCVPKTLYGFIMSPLMIPAPHCQGLRWVVYNSANIITNMWVILGTWVCSVLVININKKSDL